MNVHSKIIIRIIWIVCTEEDMEMRINRVNIKNYKSMRASGDIVVGQEIYALIGQNNAGKSTILDAIQCLFPDAKRSVEYKDLYNRQENVVIEIEFCGVTKEYVELKLFSEQIEKYNNELKALIENNESPDVVAKKIKSHKDKMEKQLQATIDKYEIVDETMILRLVVPVKGGSIAKKYIETRSSGTTISDADVKKILPILKVIPAIRNPQNESTAGNNSYMKDLIQMLDDGIQTSIEVGNKRINYNQLNAILAEESNNRCKALSEKITRKYAETVGNEDFEISITSDVNIAKGTSYTTKLIDKVTNLESDMMNCGTGYQSMVILSILETYVELAEKKMGYILIIEEPEVYLHPSLQRKMISTLIRLSKDNQVLFSTHSPISVSSLSRNQIGLVVKENGEAHVETINIKKVISELGICPDDILMEQGVIMVEGKDDERIVREILRKIDESKAHKVNVIYTGSCTNLRFYANAEKLLNYNYNVPLLIIRDADSKTAEEQRNALKKEISDALKNTSNRSNTVNDDEIFIVGKHSIESLFLFGKILAELTNCPVEDCEEVINIYNYVYDRQCIGVMTEDRFAKFYQPKYFLEKNLDSFGWRDENPNRERWDESYYSEWKKAIRIIYPEKGDEKFDKFKRIREAVNAYTCQKAKENINYLLEIIERIRLDEMKNSLFKELVVALEDFLSKI